MVMRFTRIQTWPAIALSGRRRFAIRIVVTSGAQVKLYAGEKQPSAGKNLFESGVVESAAAAVA